MIQIEDVLQEAMASLEAALAGLKWVVTDSGPVVEHFTGRGPEWHVELLVIGAERAATARRGSLILKMTPLQVEAAERYARYDIQSSEICCLCGGQLRALRHRAIGDPDFCPFLKR